MISPYERPTHEVRIQAGRSFGTATIAVDGLELRTVTRAVLTLDAQDQIPTLDLTLVVLEDLQTGLPARILLDDTTSKVLQAMGWTPPHGGIPGQGI